MTAGPLRLHAAHTPWSAALTAQDHAQLDPGPTDLPSTADIVVIGGGAVGLASAYACAGLGKVVVIERCTVASGPSGHAAGVLAPAVHPELPDAYTSLRLHMDWDLGATPLTLQLASSRVDGQWRIDPLQWCARLASRVGAVFTRVEALSWDDAVVRTNRGDISCGAVVVATGASEWVKGHLVSTLPLRKPLDAAIVTDIIAAPLPDGRVVAGGTIDPGLDAAPDASRLQWIERRLRELIPDAVVEHGWCCFRPAGPMRVRRTAERVVTAEGMWKTGMLMAPWAGTRVAALLCGDS